MPLHRKAKTPRPSWHPFPSVGAVLTCRSTAFTRALVMNPNTPSCLKLQGEESPKAGQSELKRRKKSNTSENGIDAGPVCVKQAASGQRSPPPSWSASFQLAMEGRWRRHRLLRLRPPPSHYNYWYLPAGAERNSAVAMCRGSTRRTASLCASRVLW